MSSPHPATPRRIGRMLAGADREVPNVLWALLHGFLEFLTAPIDPVRLTDDPTLVLPADDLDITDVYTAARLQAQPPAILASLKQSLPEDIAALPADQLGYTEADVIDWLFSPHQPKLLTISAPLGSGKSSLIHYLFRHLRNRCPSLKSFLPILLDLRTAPSTALTTKDLYALTFDALLRAAHGNGDPTLTDTLAIDSTALYLQRIADNTDVTDRAFHIQLLSRHLTAITVACHSLRLQPVLIFDNSDQLLPESVALILQLARFIVIRHQLKVIVPMRPHTARTQYEIPSEQRSLVYSIIDLPPPDLAHLLRRRLEYLSTAKDSPLRRSLLMTMPGTMPIEIKHIDSLLRQLVDFFLQPDLQDFLYKHICNFNVRSVLICCRRFLQHSRLPVRAFHLHAALSLPIGAALSERTKLEPFDLINGIMLGPSTVYRESDSSVVINLFTTGAGDIPLDHVVQYRLLQLLAWKNTFMHRAACFASLVSLGHDLEVARAATTKLLRGGLLQSPEHDLEMDYVDSLQIGPSGRHYLLSLAVDQDYLFNVIVDTPLPHLAWDGLEIKVSDRIYAICELIERVALAEESQLAVLRAGKEQWLVQPLLATGLLCGRLCSAAARLLAESAKRMPSSSVIELQGQLRRLTDEKVKPVEEAAKAIEREWTERLGHAQELCRVGLGSGGFVEVAGPTAFQEGDQFAIRIRCRGGKGSGKEPIGVFLDLSGLDSRDGEMPVVTFLPTETMAESAVVCQANRSCERLTGSVFVTSAGHLLGKVLFR